MKRLSWTDWMLLTFIGQFRDFTLGFSLSETFESWRAERIGSGSIDQIGRSSRGRA